MGGRLAGWAARGCEAVAALLMAALFLTFVLQITIRYTARLDWLVTAFPILDPSRFGWTLEFCLALWLWIVFWGNAFVVRERDHVTFDILYDRVGPRLRKWFAVIGAIVVALALLWSLEPTWQRLDILRLKKTATLSALLGDWVRMRDIYAIYVLFLVAVAARYAWRAWQIARHGAEIRTPHSEGRLDD
jgi:C4-dicarboxylate transporter, DctQ subunit